MKNYNRLKHLQKIKDFSDEINKQQATEQGQAELPPTPKPNKHPLTWMLFGATLTAFMGGYWDTLQENRLLKQALLYAPATTQSFKPASTGFDIYERVQIPAQNRPVKIKTNKPLTPTDPGFYCRDRVGGCGVGI